MDDLSYSDILKMQRDAEDRAREMNSRATKGEEDNFSAFREKQSFSPRKASPASDDDRLLILALLLILSKSGNDKMTMFALLYILM